MISIIIPVYNSEKCLKKCLDSIINQEYSNFEIILVDDGSIDESYRICREYSENFKNIIVKKTSNKGVSSARNTGLELSNGEYIMFIDSDDFLEKHSLEKCMDIIQNKQLDILKFNMAYNYKKIKLKRKYIVENNIVFNSADYKKKLYKYVFYSDDFCNVTDAIFKKSIISNNRFNIDLKMGEDFVFFIDALYNSNKIMFINECFYNYVFYNGEGTTRQKDINKNIQLCKDAIKANIMVEEKLNLNDRYLKSSRNLCILFDFAIGMNSYNQYYNLINKIKSNSMIFDEYIYVRSKKDIVEYFNLNKSTFFKIKIKYILKKFIKKIINT